jgi:hypothetical protein
MNPTGREKHHAREGSTAEHMRAPMTGDQAGYKKSYEEHIQISNNTKLENVMPKLTLVLSGLAILATSICQPVHANAQTTTKPQTFYVGTCKPGKADYTTIQEAVTGVPAGSIINVCPGNYPDQVTIQQSLTLQGVTSGNNANVVITAPPGGVTVNAAARLPVAAQLSVLNAGGSVDISNITVDGTGFTGVSLGNPVGIFYDSSSGTLNHVVSQNIQASTNGGQVFGIAAFDDSNVAPTISVKNSFVRLSDQFSSSPVGIEILGDLTIDLENNYILDSGHVGSNGIGLDLVSGGTVSGNTLDMGNHDNTVGIVIASSAGPITTSGNLVNNSAFGIFVDVQTTALTLSNNTLSTLATGIIGISASNLTIKGNQFLSSVSSSGIDLGCQATGLTLSGNIFMGGAIGIANVPSGASLPKNLGTFIGVPTIEQLCP